MSNLDYFDELSVSGLDDDEMDNENLIDDKIKDLYTQKDLSMCIKRRISEYELDYILSELKEDKKEYWIMILLKIVKNYKLISLKNIMFPMSDINMVEFLPKFLRFIKIDLINNIEELNKNYLGDREFIIKWISKIDINSEFIKFFEISDNVSIFRFIDVLKKESELEYN